MFFYDSAQITDFFDLGIYSNSNGQKFDFKLSLDQFKKRVNLLNGDVRLIKLPENNVQWSIWLDLS